MISEAHCIDCLEFMKQQPDKRFDLVVADPPYGDPNNIIGGGGGVPPPPLTYYSLLPL